MNEKCDVIRDLLPLYADGACTDESRKLVESHIETCQTCRKELDEMNNCPGIETKDAEVGPAMRKVKKKIGKQKKKAVICAVAISLAVCLLLGIAAVGEAARYAVRENFRMEYLDTKSQTDNLNEEYSGKYFNISDRANGTTDLGGMKISLPEKYGKAEFESKPGNAYLWEKGKNKIIVIAGGEDTRTAGEGFNALLEKILNRGARTKGFDSALSKEFIHYLWDCDIPEHCGLFASPKAKLWEFTYYSAFYYCVPVIPNEYYMFRFENEDYSAIGALGYSVENDYSDYVRRTFCEVYSKSDGKIYTVIIGGLTKEECEYILSSVTF